MADFIPVSFVISKTYVRDNIYAQNTEGYAIIFEYDNEIL